MAFTYRNSHSGTTVSFDAAQPDLVAAGHWTLIADDLDAAAVAAVAELDALRDPAAAQAALVEAARLTRESGHDGPVGPQGPAGEDGEDGEDGADSVVAGPQGPEGDPGADSVVAGPEGPAGDDGATGPQGPAGPEGPEGDAGATGATGAAGADGATGATGATGPAGTQPFTRDVANTRTYATEIGDGFIVGSDRYNDESAVTTKDNRMFYNKSKAAFRAGRATADQWDTGNTGDYSAAFGSNNVASGSSALAAGSSGTSSGASAMSVGSFCTASGNYSFVAGQQSQANATAAFAAGGDCLANGDQSVAVGNYAKATRVAQFALGSGFFATAGDSQSSIFVVRRSTTNATPAVLVSGTSGTITATGAPTENVWTIGTNRACRFRIEAVAHRYDVAGETAGWTITGTLVRDATGNARFIATPTVVTESEGGASAWTLVATVDTTSQYLKLTCTGEASKTIRWIATIYATEC